MSASPPVKTSARFSFKSFLLLAVPCAAVVLVGAAFLAKAGGKTHDGDYLRLMAEYAQHYGPRARLDEELYSDKDGDLVADAPVDPANQLRPEKVVFAGLSQDDPARQKVVWKDLVEHLAREVGKPAECDTSLAEPEAQIEALRTGKVHVTVFSTGLVPAAVNTAGFVPVCVPANDKGEYGYQMEILVPADSSVRTVAYLCGRQMTFSRVSSNAGMKAPIYLLGANFALELGKDYAFNISGSYAQSLQGLAAGRFEAATVANDVLEREVARGTLRREQVRSIFKSESFPPLCLGHAHNLDPELAAKVRKALLSFPWKGTSVAAEFAPAGLTQFVEVNYKKDWAFVRTIDEGMLHLAERSK